MARPLEYDAKKHPKKLQEYIDSCFGVRRVPVYSTRLEWDGTGKKRKRVSRKYISAHETEVKYPTIEGGALAIGVHKDTMYAWEKDHPAFSDVMAVLRAKQADFLQNHGLSGKFNPTIGKVLLTKHGYREGIESSGPDGGPIPIDDKRKAAVEKAIEDVI